MEDAPRRRAGLALAALLAVQTSGCGTIMYPERRGQRGGRIDAGVAVLDGVGLLFFIIPGVVAFAVDFGNGCIYLPPGRSADARPLRFDPAGGTRAVEEAVSVRTGRPVRLDGDGVRAREPASRAELAGWLAAASPAPAGPEK